MKGFSADESGQATTEYVLLLATVVLMFLSVRKLLQPMLGKVQDAFLGKLDRMFMNDDALHQFRIGH